MPNVLRVNEEAISRFLILGYLYEKENKKVASRI